MRKDLRSSQVDRKNILNNELVVIEVQKISRINGISFEDKLYLTKEIVADFFKVDIRTIEQYILSFLDELKENGYTILEGAKLKYFLKTFSDHFGADINICTKTTVLGVFDFKAFLNIAMLLSESENARILRQLILDVVIDLINQKTGGGTKYVDQCDKDFIEAYLQQENYRREFTDALHDYVDMGSIKYEIFTDKIYQIIFKEKSCTYRETLKLHKKKNTRDTLYFEVLDILGSYECALAVQIKEQSEAIGRKLNNWEVNDIFHAFELLPHWRTLIFRAKIKMENISLILREDFHKGFDENTKPLEREEYKRFIGGERVQIEKLMQDNKDVLKRLKERG